MGGLVPLYEVSLDPASLFFAPLGSILTGQNGRKPAKGGAFPLLVESTPLFWAVRSCFPARAEGRLPYQEGTQLSFARSLLGWCNLLPISALPVAHPGRRRPGEAAPPRLEALVEGERTASGVETAQRCVGPSNQPHQAQGRLGPVQEKNNEILGFPKGSPFGGSLVTFCPSESHPAEQTLPAGGTPKFRSASVSLYCAEFTLDTVRVWRYNVHHDKTRTDEACRKRPPYGLPKE